MCVCVCVYVCVHVCVCVCVCDVCVCVCVSLLDIVCMPFLTSLQYWDFQIMMIGDVGKKMCTCVYAVAGMHGVSCSCRVSPLCTQPRHILHKQMEFQLLN